LKGPRNGVRTDGGDRRGMLGKSGREKRGKQKKKTTRPRKGKGSWRRE